ncbi:MAG: hypothetical protein WED15_06135 [Akkermansiaceae bacterium]
MKRSVISGIALALLIAFGLWWFSAAEVLKRRTQSLLSTLTLDAGTGRASRTLATYSLNKLLAPWVELDTPTIREANGNFERVELESGFNWISQQAKQTRFELEKFHSVTIAGDTGNVKLTLFGLVELPHYRPADGNYAVSLDWKNGDDGWRLTQAVWTQMP